MPTPVSSIPRARASGAETTPDQWLALAWFYHRRFESLTEAMGIRRFVLASKRPKPWRDLILMARTFALLWRERPRVVMVQNPSAVCTLFVTLLRPFFGYGIVVDGHNDAIMPYVHGSAFVKRVTYWLLRNTDLTIVTNPALADIVEKDHGGRAFVLYDNLPHVPDVAPKDLGPGRHIMFICTYAPDEPLAELFTAAASLTDLPVTFHVTGRPKPARLAELPPVPANVRLSGFLPEVDYWALLKACDLIIDLSTMPHCLVCGAYESLAASKPLLLSDEASGRALFRDGAQYTVNTAEGIAEQVRAYCRREDDGAALRSKAQARAQWLVTDWSVRASELARRMARGLPRP